MLLAFVAAWGITFLFVVALTCNISKPWVLIEEQCPNYVSSSFQVSTRHIPSKVTDLNSKPLRWQIMESLGCVHELATLGMSVWLVWSLKTSRSNKMIVAFAFGFRLWCVASTGTLVEFACKTDFKFKALS